MLTPVSEPEDYQQVSRELTDHQQRLIQSFKDAFAAFENHRELGRQVIQDLRRGTDKAFIQTNDERTLAQNLKDSFAAVKAERLDLIKNTGPETEYQKRRLNSAVNLELAHKRLSARSLTPPT